MAGKDKETPKTEEAPKPRKNLFAVFDKVDEVTGTDFDNVKLEIGQNKLRIISAPVLVRKHYDLPESSEMKIVPCAKFIDDLEAYLEDPEAYLAELECPYCDLEEAHGDSVNGKDKGFYNVKDSWVMNCVQDGKVKQFEVPQRSIMKAISAFENNPEWLPLMPNGLVDREIIIEKNQQGKRKQDVRYTVSGHPTNGPLAPEILAGYLKKAPDLAEMKRPPAIDDDRWQEWLKKAGAPKAGERPHQAK